MLLICISISKNHNPSNKNEFKIHARKLKGETKNKQKTRHARDGGINLRMHVIWPRKSKNSAHEVSRFYEKSYGEESRLSTNYVTKDPNVLKAKSKEMHPFSQQVECLVSKDRNQCILNTHNRNLVWGNCYTWWKNSEAKRTPGGSQGLGTGVSSDVLVSGQQLALGKKPWYVSFSNLGMQVLLLWPISSCQHEVTECRVGERCVPAVSVSWYVAAPIHYW